MFRVIKRDGEIAEFQLDKITEAIRKAFEANGKVYQRYAGDAGTSCDCRFSEED